MPATPEIPPSLEPALLCALADESVPLPALSERFKIPLETIAAWTQRPEIAARLELVIQLARSRARLLCAERASAAVHTLDHVQALLFSSDLSDARPSTRVALAESARRAATTVLRHAGLTDEPGDAPPPGGPGVPPVRKQASPASTPHPQRGAPAPPTPETPQAPTSQKTPAIQPPTPTTPPPPPTTPPPAPTSIKKPPAPLTRPSPPRPNPEIPPPPHPSPSALLPSLQPLRAPAPAP